MIALDDWRRRAARAPEADPDRLFGEGAFVVLAPHPDDESIGCSGLLLAAARNPRTLGLVALTDGEGSHRGSTLVPPEKLAAIRAGEQAAAMATLGCGDATILRLGLPDGASGRDPRFARALDRTEAFLRDLGASAIAAPHPDDPHPDHHAAAAMALELRRRIPRLRVLFYEVWTRRLPGETLFRDEGCTPFRVRTDAAVKRAALDRHASQLGRVVFDDPAGFVLPDWFLRAQDEPFETVSWLAMPGRVPGAEHFQRLYADDGDPWHVRSSAYERDKREAAIRLLGERRYGHSLECGCGEGHLTGVLLAAGSVRAGTGFDREPAVVARAAAKNWGEAAHFVTGSMADALPEGGFDLVILSEVLYFLDEVGLAALVEALRERMGEGADLLLVSYRGPTDTPLEGPVAADVFAALLGREARRVRLKEMPDYRMELLEWRREPAEAPADGPADPNAEAADASGSD